MMRPDPLMQKVMTPEQGEAWHAANSVSLPNAMSKMSEAARQAAKAIQQMSVAMSKIRLVTPVQFDLDLKEMRIATSHGSDSDHS